MSQETLVTVFKHRTWRKIDGDWQPAGDCQRKVVRTGVTEADARRICQEANRHAPEYGTEAYFNFSWCEFTANY